MMHHPSPIPLPWLVPTAKVPVSLPHTPLRFASPAKWQKQREAETLVFICLLLQAGYGYSLHCSPVRPSRRHGQLTGSPRRDLFPGELERDRPWACRMRPCQCHIAMASAASVSDGRKQPKAFKKGHLLFTTTFFFGKNEKDVFSATVLLLW